MSGSSEPSTGKYSIERCNERRYPAVLGVSVNVSRLGRVRSLSDWGHARRHYADRVSRFH
jgi:hypothetical protein